MIRNPSEVNVDCRGVCSCILIFKEERRKIVFCKAKTDKIRFHCAKYRISCLLFYSLNSQEK